MTNRLLGPAALAMKLSHPVSALSLAAFRIALGALLVVDFWRFIKHDRIWRYWVQPDFHFTYPGFSWVAPLPEPWIHVAWLAMGVFALLVGLYSAVLGFFIPSAGGKWVIEAPYVMAAANGVGAHLGWTVMIYNIAETLPNLINPFWMLPLLGILGLRPKDLVGYTSVQFLIHLPVALLLAVVLMGTFAYRPPVLP